MKRSKQIALLSMGVSALALTACGDATTPVNIYKSEAQCIRDSSLTPDECKQRFAEAAKQHEKVAPKFKSQAECEAEFGKERCETAAKAAEQQQQAGGSAASFWMPLMMGYMAGRMMGGGMGSQPLYRGRNDANFRTSDGANVGSRTGKVNVPQSATRQPTTKTRTRAPNRRFGSTSQRKGFGASGRRFGGGTSSRRGFGG